MVWVETALGRVPVWGRANSERPIVLAIRGAFPEPHHLADLAPPNQDLVLLHLPGFHSPALAATSIGAFAAAFDEVIRKHFTGREITAVGVSTGALVALALRAPEVRRVLAVEPFFSTAHLWPLVEWVQHELRRNPAPLLHHWCEAIFGYTGTAVCDRRYEPVLNGPPRPTVALVGDVPLLPRRPLTILPSLTNEVDRARLPVRVTPGGHNLPTAAIRSALIDLHKEDEETPGSAWRERIATAASTSPRS